MNTNHSCLLIKGKLVVAEEVPLKRIDVVWFRSSQRSAALDSASAYPCQVHPTIDSIKTMKLVQSLTRFSCICCHCLALFRDGVVDTKVNTHITG